MVVDADDDDCANAPEAPISDSSSEYYLDACATYKDSFASNDDELDSFGSDCTDSICSEDNTVLVR
jgi:hypothetical protein